MLRVAFSFSLLIFVSNLASCSGVDLERCRPADFSCSDVAPFLYFLNQPGIVTGATIAPAVGRSFWRLERLDGDGTSLWQRDFFTNFATPNNIVEVRWMPDGGIAVYGSFDAGANSDHYLFKYSPEGLELWQRFWGQPSNETAAAAAVDAAGSIYAVGDFHNGANTDWWIKKFSSDGVEDTSGWNKTLNGAANVNDSPSDIHVSTDGSIYVSGSIDDGGGSEGAVRKFLSDGTEVTAGWNKRLGTTITCTTSCLMATDLAGNLYLAATINTGDADWYLRKFAPDGVEFGGNFPYRLGIAGGADTLFSIEMGNHSDLYLTGSLDPTASAAQLEGLFLRLDLDGNFISQHRTNLGSETDNYVGVQIDRFGRVYYAGGVSDIAGASGFDRSLIRMNPNGLIDGNPNWSGTGVDAGFSQTDFYLSIDVQ